MGIRLFFAYVVLRKVYGSIFTDMIIDYFVYKEVPSVVGFSCQKAEDDLWLLKIFSRRNIKANLYKISNQSISTVIDDVNYWKLGIFIDVRCQTVEDLTSALSETSKHRTYGELSNWLMIGADLADTLNFVNDEAFGLSTDFVIAIPSSNGDFQFYDIYNSFKDRGTELNVTSLGSWNNKTSLIVMLTQPKFIRRANLHGLNLRIGFYKSSYKPANMVFVDYLEDNQQTTKDGRSKFGYHLLKCFSEMHNFSLETEETLDWKRGDPLGPLTRALINNSVDIVGSPFSMSVSRIKLLKYVHQDWRFRSCFIFRSPQPVNIRVGEIFRPLANLTWYLMIMTLTIALVILSIALYCDQDKSNFPRMSDSFLINVGAVSQQGTNIVMRRLSTRIIFLCLMIFSLLMYNYYSASVVSARLDEPIFKINDSLNELSKMNLKFASEWIVYLEFLFKSPEWEIQQFYKKLWMKLPESKRFMEPEVGLKLVQEGGFAYHLHPEVGYPLIEKTFTNREICELMEVHLARPSYTAFGVPMNSPIVEISRIGLTKISEVGLRHREDNRWQYKKPICRKDILNAASITMEEFSPHLILLVMGIFLSIVIFLGEIIVMKYIEYRKSGIRNRKRELISS